MEGMKKYPLHLMMVGAAVVLVSCSAGTDLYVTTPQGDPLAGVVLEPVALTYGCKAEVYTGYCGDVDVPPAMKQQGWVNLKRVGFEPLHNVDVSRPGPLHVVMRQAAR